MATAALLARKQFLAQAAKYYTVGGVAVGLDVLLFQILLLFGALPVLAAGSSYALAAAVHFTINRYWSFRAIHRRVESQAGTYVVVAGLGWLTTLLVVYAVTHVLHATPLLAKLIAIVATLPIGFFGHKYLTYRDGIRAALRSLGVGLNESARRPQ